MNPLSRGIKNAFRNTTRTVSIVVILGLSMGLALTMLVAHQAVSDKIASVKASVGNTITIAPAGFSGFSQVNNSLTTSQLAPISNIDHVVSVDQTLTDRLTTIGSSSPSFGGFGGSSSSSTTSNAQTSLTSPVTLNSGSGGHLFAAGGGSGFTLPANFSLPITITGTTNPTNVSGTAINITSGKTISGTADTDNALISSSMASKNNLKVGSIFTAYGQSMDVAGIFSTSSTNSTRTTDNTIIVSLPAEQRLSGQAGAVTSATVYVDSLDNLNSVTNSIKTQLGSNADVTSSVQEADSAVQPLNSVQSISIYSLIGAVIAGGVIILLTMVMIVRERTREIGVIKAIGASNLKVSLQFMSEATTLTIIGALIGIVLAAFASNPITHLLITTSSSSTTQTIGAGGGAGRFGGGGGGFAAAGGAHFSTSSRGAFGFVRNNFTNIHAAAGWSLLGYGLLAAIVIALIGSATVSYFIAKIRPAVVLRTE